MKKVYILINHFQIQDGIARTAVGLANELASRGGIEVTLQSLFKFDPKMKDLLSPKVNAKPFIGFYFRGLAKIVSLIPSKVLYKILVHEEYDAEIGFCMTLPIKIIAESSNAKCKHYAWMHGYDNGLTLLKCYQKMDKVITVSRSSEIQVKNESKGTVTAVCCHNLIDDQRVCSMGQVPVEILKGSGLSFVTVGRLEKGKGILRLVTCFARLKASGYDFQLMIVGDGEQRKELEKAILANGLKNSVHLLGAQRNPYAYMSQADALVCASYGEGYSTVCVESIMLGVPVISTCVGGAYEIIEEAQAGMVTQMDDESLYLGLKQVMDNPLQIEKWKQTLKRTKHNFSYKNRASELSALEI